MEYFITLKNVGLYMNIVMINDKDEIGKENRNGEKFNVLWERWEKRDKKSPILQLVW